LLTDRICRALNDAGARYILKKLPDDPFTKSASSVQAVPAEPDPDNPTADPDVYDVRSGSDRHRAQRHEVRRVLRHNRLSALDSKSHR
jgi:hypothetical protein